MRFFFTIILMASTFGLNFAYGMGDSFEADAAYDYRDYDYYDEDMNMEPEVIRSIQAEALCKARYNRKLELNVWLCDTNPFYQYNSEEACLSYCH